MSNTKYMREGRGACKMCARELDVVSITPRALNGPLGLVVSRHLNRIEEYGPRGASPKGFCTGSLDEPNPIKTPEPSRAKRR
jgi:hypothetical protein